MKNLILILLVMVMSGFAGADNYMSSSDVLKKNNGERGVRIFKSLARCESKTGGLCYSIDHCKNLNYCTVQDVMVDDLSKPIYEAKSLAQACSSPLECYEIIKRVCGETECTGYCDSLSPSHFAVVASTYDEVYCTKITSYEQRQVTKVAEDLVKKSLYDADAAAQSVEKIQRETKRDTRLQSLKTCVATLKNSPTVNEIRQCVLILTREAARERLNISDM